MTVASIPLLACVGILFTTVIVRARKPPQSHSSDSKVEQDAERDEETLDPHPTQRNTSFLSFILWIPYWIMDSKPVSAITRKLRGKQISPDIPRENQTDSSYEDISFLSDDAKEKPPSSQNHHDINTIETEPETEKAKEIPPPQPEPSPTTNPNPPYQAVRVLFLVWDSERSNNPCTSLVSQLRRTLGMTYHFSIHEFTIPSSNTLDTPDIPLLHYLLDNSFFFKTTERNERELVIVIYSGSGAVAHGGYNLVTSPSSQSPPARMPWDWVETRLASAPYDSLFIMNSSYVPGTVVVTAKKVRGSNMVLAALGPDSDLRREILGGRGLDVVGEGLSSPGDEVKRNSWSTGFLETILGELHRNCEDSDTEGETKASAPVNLGSVKDMYSGLLVAHQRLCNPEQGSDMRPFCDFIKGLDGEHEGRAIVIAPLGGGDRRERGEKSEEWTLVDGV